MGDTRKTVAVQFLAMLGDPADPTRTPAWHLDVVDIVTLDDGSTIFTNPRQLNMSAAAAAGFTLSGIVADMNSATQSALESTQAQVHDLQGQVAILESQLATATQPPPP